LALTIAKASIPPTAGLTELDPEIHLKVVTGSALAWTPGPSLSNSFGFGGHNGTIVMGPPAA
jgi:3-oxoacyl-[acyl-carrier-protein] synthase II